MKPASAALQALLASQEFIVADLWTFELVGGNTFLYSGGQTAITDSTTGRFFALGPRFERNAIKVTIGVQSDDLDVQVFPATTDVLQGGMSWEQAIWQGQLDGAIVTLERAFMKSWGDTSAGTIIMFAGRISDAQASRSMITLKVRSWLEFLNIEMPRRLWQPQCTYNFGDAGCGYDRVRGENAVGTSTGIGRVNFTAGPGSTTTNINVQGIAVQGFYYLGTIVGTSGANKGVQRTITGFATGQYSVKLAFPATPVVNDGFYALPGCDKTLTTCANIYLQSRVQSAGYNNGPGIAERFGGFIFVPPPENAIAVLCIATHLHGSLLLAAATIGVWLFAKPFILSLCHRFFTRKSPTSRGGRYASSHGAEALRQLSRSYGG